MSKITSLYVLLLLLFFPSLTSALTPQEQDILRKGGVSEERVNELSKTTLKPCLYDWNNDGLKDIISGTSNGELNVYLNSGSNISPVFEERFVPEEGEVDPGTDTTPCIVDWDNDGLNDVVMGNLQGTVYIYMNNGSLTHPSFEKEKKLNDGDVDAGSNSSPAVVDWNDDGNKDLILGNSKGGVLVYLNIGKDNMPSFEDEPLHTNIKVPGYATPFIEKSEDGLFNIICGSSDGKIYRFMNTGSKGNPAFSRPQLVTIDGKKIQLPGKSSVISLDWDDDGKEDLLISYSVVVNNNIAANSTGNLEPTSPKRETNIWDWTTARSLSPNDSGNRKVYILKNTGTIQNPEYKEGLEILRSKYNINL